MDLTHILLAVIDLLVAIITYKLIPWIKSKTTANQQAIMLAAVKTMVFAAEQMYGAGNGAEKLAFVKAKLQQQGFDVDTSVIEAAVAEYLNYNYQNIDLVLNEETPDENADD
ncbi:MAG: holin [Lachnospiraceae bacterium]|nr:holin [Lachnospiraceae bacterium]